MIVENNMRVLIAEDDYSSRIMLQSILTRWGYEVICAENGKEAYDLLQRDESIQLALLDWGMPIIDGISLCRLLRQHRQNKFLYLILLTARDEHSDIVQGLEAGADDYIKKPYNNEELRARIYVGVRMLKLQNALKDNEKLQGVLEMAGAVCHELNQPLQIVSGFSELLLEDLIMDDPNYETIQSIVQAIKRMGELTQKIMRISKYRSKEYLGGKSVIIDIDESVDGAS